MKCWDDVREPHLSATVHSTLTTIINRVSPNQPTRATTGLQILLCQTISNGPKIPKLNKLKTTKSPMQPTAGQPIPTALTTPKGTTRPRHPSQTGLLETRLPHGVRLLEAQAGANLMRLGPRPMRLLKVVVREVAREKAKVKVKDKAKDKTRDRTRDKTRDKEQAKVVPQRLHQSLTSTRILQLLHLCHHRLPWSQAQCKLAQARTTSKMSAMSCE